MLRTAVFAAILAGLAAFPGLSRDGTPAEDAPAATKARIVQPRLYRPRRTPPARTVCREVAIPEPVPTCEP